MSIGRYIELKYKQKYEWVNNINFNDLPLNDVTRQKKKSIFSASKSCVWVLLYSECLSFFARFYKTIQTTRTQYLHTTRSVTRKGRATPPLS